MKHIPDDYFLTIDDDLLAYLEKQGEDCIRELQQSNTINKENGYKLLSILIVGIGSSFMFLTQRHRFDFMSAGITVFTVYWTICAIYLVLKILAVRQRGMIATSPELLYHQGYKEITNDDFEDFKRRGFSGEPSTLGVMRRYRLKGICTTADELSKVNSLLGTALTRVRIAVIITPVCAIVVSTLTYLFF
ncbi:hypothetical protein CBX45_016865 [Salmonella bongori serovar 48:z81:-]|uniref:hypothetical protein n=1 Tax=Salmonella bongori TaxID=54736 RepID=UPI00142C28F7|nr:hypothetical protein [Salmonella bongori]MBA3230120.1 hypothetical protein [Salmonella bongori serovar 48:z81:-]